MDKKVSHYACLVKQNNSNIFYIETISHKPNLAVIVFEIIPYYKTFPKGIITGQTENQYFF